MLSIFFEVLLKNYNTIGKFKQRYNVIIVDIYNSHTSPLEFNEIASDAVGPPNKGRKYSASIRWINDVETLLPSIALLD